MGEDSQVEQVDIAARLRFVDAEISGRHARPSGETDSGSGRVRSIVPEPRRVRVFLRGPGDLGEFSRITITHPVVPRPRIRRYV